MDKDKIEACMAVQDIEKHMIKEEIEDFKQEYPIHKDKTDDEIMNLIIDDEKRFTYLLGANIAVDKMKIWLKHGKIL